MATERLKLVFIGPAATGKTQLINWATNNTFESAYKTTIGIALVIKNFSLKHNQVRAELWDTAGKDCFEILLPSHVKDKNAVVIVLVALAEQGASLDRETLKVQARKFYNLAKTEALDNAHIHFVINKTDLSADLYGEQEQVKAVLAEVAKIPVSFCSAKTGTNVDETFEQILLAAYRPKKEDENVPPSKSSSPVGKFLADHKKLLLGNVVLIAAAIIALTLLAAFPPVGGLIVLGGLSALAVAGITAGVALLFWNVGGIIGNWLFKDDVPPSGEDLSRVSPKPGSPAPQQLPGGPRHGSVYSPDPEKTEDKNPGAPPPPTLNL